MSKGPYHQPDYFPEDEAEFRQPGKEEEEETEEEDNLSNCEKNFVDVMFCWKLYWCTFKNLSQICSGNALREILLEKSLSKIFVPKWTMNVPIKTHWA